MAEGERLSSVVTGWYRTGCDTQGEANRPKGDYVTTLPYTPGSSVSVQDRLRVSEERVRLWSPFSAPLGLPAQVAQAHATPRARVPIPPVQAAAPARLRFGFPSAGRPPALSSLLSRGEVTPYHPGSTRQVRSTNKLTDKTITLAGL